MANAGSELETTEKILTQKNQNFFPALDFLRALAVIMVVIDHTMLALHRPKLFGWDAGYLGILGVWMFFVHTALVLMWSLERKPYTLDFYIRRIFRIYPLAITAVIVAVFTHAPLLGPLDDFFQYHSATRGNIVATSLLVYNLAPSHLHYHQIMNVMWSLPLEIDMYLVLPVLFSFARRDRTLWPLLLMWGLATATAHLYFQTTLNFISAVPDFLSGVIAFVGFKRFQPRVPAWIFPFFLVGLIALVMVSPQLSMAWPFSLALGLALPHFRQMSASVFTKVCHHVAKYSYGIYLVHPFALVLGVHLLRGHSMAVQLSVEVAVIAIVSVASYHLLEKPMIDLGSRIAAKLEVRSLARSPEGARRSL